MHTVFWLEYYKGKRPFRRHRRRWADNVGMDLRQIGREVDWIHLAQGTGEW
jgi:hypothetical protein